MDVLSLMIKRAEYGFNRREKDLFLDEIVRSNEDEIAIVHTENGLRFHGPNNENLIHLLDTYNLKGMFGLKNPYSNTNVDVFLYVAVMLYVPAGRLIVSDASPFFGHLVRRA